MKNVLQITDLHKSFGSIKAVDGISFSVKEGELFAYLGENGAGKSTTINMICGVLTPDSGSIQIGDHGSASDNDIKRMVGVVFQNSVLDFDLTVRDNLLSRAALYGIFGGEFEERMRFLTDILDLSDLLDRPLGKLSGGQKRRIDIARALIHSPKLLILDEPTTGLDPQTRRMIWDVIAELRKNSGMTVFLTTHYMEEAAEADNIVIIEKGRILDEGTPHALKTKYVEDRITLYGAKEADVASLGYRYEFVGDTAKIFIPDTVHATSLICEHPEIFRDYEVEKGKMDDVFLTLMKSVEGGAKE